MPMYITVFTFDFSGCGLSEGEYISLGYYERDDVEAIINYLRQSDEISTIALWGRSMGAVTALMYADRDPSIAALVLDSPFSNLKVLAEELCDSQVSLPGFIRSAALGAVRSSIKSRANFDIFDLNPLENHVKKVIFVNKRLSYLLCLLQANKIHL